MKILFVATKVPWPPIDGGRLLLRETLVALDAAGHATTLVAPVATSAERERAEAERPPGCRLRLVIAQPANTFSAYLRARALDLPLSISRHSLPAVRREVAFALAEERFDVVHVEQLQALAQSADAADRGVPVVLRAQNVESDLWHATARRFQGWRSRWIEREAERLATWEGGAIASADAAIAISTLDADRLRDLARITEDEGSHAAPRATSERARVRYAPAPYPVTQPQAESPLRGRPAVVVLGSGGWPPNREGAAWFAREAWPVVHASLPDATLHLFGQSIDVPAGFHQGIEIHPSPTASVEAFAPGSILVVPLRVASGIRMKILEAWSRGVPVVATPEAAAGLDAHDGREILLARDPKTFARAISRLAREPELASAMVAHGRARLIETHEPTRATRELIAVYSDVLHRRVPQATS